MKIKPTKEQSEMEKAIIMAVDCIRQKCNNDKPLILHSLRVGFKLADIEQPQEVVIAGILHDLVEDTDCTINQIKNKFGSKVANLVSACSHSSHPRINKDQWPIFIDQIMKAGKPAMFIKIADADANLPYTILIEDNEYLKEILWKHKTVIEKLKPQMGNTEIFKEYHQNYQEMINKLKDRLT